MSVKLECLIHNLYVETQKKEAAEEEITKLKDKLKESEEESARLLDLTRCLMDKLLPTSDRRSQLKEEVADSSEAIENRPLPRFPDDVSIISSDFLPVHPREYDPTASEYSGPPPKRRNRDPMPSTSHEIHVPYSPTPSVTEYTRYDYLPSPNETPDNISPRNYPSHSIPSLLSLKLPIPKGVSEETVKFLRQQSRPGCWNCGNVNHRYPECHMPALRLFCYRCGKPNFTVDQCPECARMYRVIMEHHEKHPST